MYALLLYDAKRYLDYHLYTDTLWVNSATAVSHPEYYSNNSSMYVACYLYFVDFQLILLTDPGRLTLCEHTKLSADFTGLSCMSF